MEDEQNKPSILGVEDESSLARFLQLELDPQGYKVETAANGF